MWKKVDKPKKIFDNIYGFIELDKDEINIVQHPLFQRLKNIKQLGFSYFVFPGATHTRFAHSLGVFHLTKELLKNINTNRLSNSFELSDDDARDICMAALLHDLGHYPFSHTLEKTFFNKKHELNTKHVLERSKINNYLEENGYDTQKIYNIISGEYVGIDNNDLFLRQLLNSELDSDRLDYLTRDSYHTGTPFGKIDINNILRNALVVNGELHFDSKSIRSIDHYLNARVSMYDTVYTHKTSMIFDLMFARICELLDEHTNFSDIVKSHDVNIEKFQFFDDNMVLSKFYEIFIALKRKNGLNKEESGLLNLIKRFLGRDPYKLIFEKSSFFIRERAFNVRDPEASK
ncbi:MAG: HD domain-containing protein, partial [Promethearchaeota archaeon]